MTLSADFRTVHGAVLRNVRPSDANTAQQAEHDDSGVITHSETRVFTVFPERTARIQAELHDSFRRRMCLIGMCAPTSVFLALAAWYVVL